MDDIVETGADAAADAEGLWTEDQAAAFVNTHKNALYRHRVAGTGPAFILVTKSQVRYRPSVVKAWLKAREFSSMAAFYRSDQERAHAVERQRQAASKARQTRWPKKPEAAEADLEPSFGPGQALKGMAGVPHPTRKLSKAAHGHRRAAQGEI